MQTIAYLILNALSNRATTNYNCLVREISHNAKLPALITIILQQSIKQRVVELNFNSTQYMNSEGSRMHKSMED